MSTPSIDVLLPAYNGASYIREQIQSILNQDYVGELHIHVRDDGSSDDTVTIVQQMMTETLPLQRSLSLEQRADSLGGVSHNVSALIHGVLHKAKYFALADQDDVWLPYKLRIQMEVMQQAESALSTTVEKPLLVCTDLTIVGADLQPLHHSLWRLQRLDPLWAKRWQDLLVQNMVTGCTSLFNRAAASVILPIPYEHGIFHDHWMATAVAYYGQVIPLDEQTVLYRQHGKNVEAAHAFNAGYVQRKLKQLKLINKRSQTIASYLGQSRNFPTLLCHKLRLGIKRLFL